MTRKRYQKLSRAFGLRLIAESDKQTLPCKTGRLVRSFANANPPAASGVSYADGWKALCKALPNIAEGIGTENERKNSRKIQTAGGVYHV